MYYDESNFTLIISDILAKYMCDWALFVEEYGVYLSNISYSSLEKDELKKYS